MPRCETIVPSQINSDDVFYTGPYLPNLDINTQTNLTVILQAINSLITGSSQPTTILKFTVGDGALYSPVNGATQYNNPTLAGKTGGLIIRNGLPILQGITYLPTGGFQLAPGDQFNTGEEFVWIINININNIPPDYSQYIKRENVATFADITLAGDERMIVVETDENNSGNRGLYYFKNSQLTWIISQPI